MGNPMPGIGGWTTVDVWGTPDIEYDFRAAAIPSVEHVSAIRAIHSLEHLCRVDVVPTLQAWYSQLEPGGELTVEVPDLDWACRQIVGGDLSALQFLYGGQTQPYDFHRTGFTATSLRAALVAAGFEEPRIYAVHSHGGQSLVAETIRG